MTNQISSWAVLVYGYLLIGLGYLAYSNTGSLISLQMGVAFGLLLNGCAFGMFMRKKGASYAALIFSFILTVTFSIRYAKTGKDIPAILALMSAFMLLLLLVQLVKWKK